MKTHCRHCRRGMTLAELLISLTVTVFIGLAVATMLQAASFGTSTKRDFRRTAVRTEVVRNRLNDAIRNARAVLASGAGYIVLWRGDLRKNDQVNLSELQLIELSGSTVTSYVTVWPASYTQTQIDTADVAYSPNTNFYNVAKGAKNGISFPGTTWVSNVSALTFSNNLTPPATSLTSWSLTLTTQTEPLVGAAGLRAQGAPQ